MSHTNPGCPENPFYDNLEAPTDSEDIVGNVSGLYVFSVGWFRNDVKKYGFSLHNNGFTNITVHWAGKTYDLTQGANTTAIDFWNAKTFTPSKTDATFTQDVGGVVLISSP